MNDNGSVEHGVVDGGLREPVNSSFLVQGINISTVLVLTKRR